MLKKLLMLFQALNKNSNPAEIAKAVCCGLILGFLPKGNLLWYVLTVCFLFIRINKSALIIFTFLFSLLAPAFDGLFDNIGYYILNIKALTPVFGTILNIPLLGYTKINNSIVCGSLVSSLVLFAPVYFASLGFVKAWRATLAPALRKTKLVKLVAKLPLIKKIGEMV